MTSLENAYRGRSVLVTGDSGFKGSWLCRWLQSLGARVTGYGLAPATTPNHWDLLSFSYPSHRYDITDISRLASTVKQAAPEIVFHLAAQPLVRRSYSEPLLTWSSNVMGTANLLEACRHQPSVQAIVLVTTDKVYRNQEWSWGYREDDPLGGHDPYSASKAACELVAASYRASYFSAPDAPLLATVRSGNVIGGGDWSEDRLIPDLVRAVSTSSAIEIRSPNATRPWQHVLECLSGYLLVGKRLLAGDRSCAAAWNFGPDSNDNRRVIDILEAIKVFWPEVMWQVHPAPQLHEAKLLYLDNSKAKSLLGWKPVWTLDVALEKTADWYRSHAELGRVLTDEQIAEFVDESLVRDYRPQGVSA